ncbi:TonB-dependent receptor [Ferrimonas marina]|uniref:Iron complex outermembrane recepter protein n=1 Tax=Ferrimonas marina TaxID=299255 RepID=A0A1M5RXM9_9GAMM|nr:TonB-dependent receptor [Ferrimonas marina]SHH31112.1 iron complex outermembrane recepter protein [Ferrimonas marina]
MESALFRPTLLSCAIAASLMGVALPSQVLAEEVLEQAEIEKITVVARGRVETLQSIPDSVSVYDEAMIEKARIRNVRDVADLTPNFSQLDNFRPGLARIQIRGMITPQVGEAPLAVVVDGVTAPDLEFINQDLVDIERIEVMRGAQGALYGRGAIGGAMILNTKPPSDVPETQLSASYGHANSYRLTGVTSGAISDNAFFRLGGYTRGTDGQIENTFTGEMADHFKEHGLFGQLRFELGDDTELNLRGRYGSSEGGLAYYQGVTADSWDDFSLQMSQNVVNEDNRDVMEFSARLNQYLELGQFELIAGYSESKQDSFYDSDYSAVPSDFIFHYAGAIEGIANVDAWTFESRFTSHDDQPLRWAVSAFYQDRTRYTATHSYDDPIGDQRLTRSDFGDDLLLFSILDDNRSQAWGLAGQLNYDLTDRLELTGALRYDEDKRSSVDPQDVAGTYAEDTFSQWQPKVSLAYQITDRTLLYTGYSKGFRSGGFNEPHPDVSRIYDKEVSDSFEAGFKTDFWDGRVTLNGAAFYIEQENAQITQFNVDTFTLENLSVDDVTLQGLEAELAIDLTRQLNLQLTGGIIDSEINEFERMPELVGEPQLWVSDFNFNAALNHSLPLNNGWQLESRVDLQVNGPRSFDIFLPEIRSNTTTFLNANIGLVADQWRLTAYVDNLTDERTAEDLFLLDDGVTELVRLPNQPRTFGVEMNYRF